MKRFTIFVILMLSVVFLCYGADIMITEQSDSAEFYRPQTPKPPFPYIVEDVSYFNQSKSIQFGGTLTIPENGDKHPVAILIPGTGQTDRDVTAAGHKFFWVIADHLTKNGIAVLRVDDRGVGDTSGKETVADATSYDYAMDVADGIKFLKSHHSIDTTKIGLIGHSGGAIIASILGAERNDIAFIVSMAGVSISFKEVCIYQTKTILQRLYPSHNIDSISKYQSVVIDIIKEVKDSKIAEEKIRELFSYELFINQDSLTQTLLGFEIDSLQRGYSISNRFYVRYLTPWFVHICTFNPALTYQKIAAPFLAINGDKDWQVKADQNLNSFKSIFDKCGKTNYKIIKYPDLNHGFQHCKTGYWDENASIEETISTDVLNDIANWINEQIKHNNTP